MKLEIEIQDKHNPFKIWLIRKYNTAFYINQKNRGQILNKRYQRTTKKNLLSVLELNNKELMRKFKIKAHKMGIKV